MDEFVGKPKHVVVLMFENRSFDHIFGAFPGVNGLFSPDGSFKPEIYNQADPTQAPGVEPNLVVFSSAITPNTPLKHDFDHNFGNGMMQELFGPGTTGVQAGQPINAPAQTYPAINSGFYSTVAYNVSPPVINGEQVMSYYEYGSLQVLHGIAADFVLCDNWFCDMPADTLLNRYFMHAAQTNGDISDSQSGDITLPSPTIFDQLDAQNLSWKMYAPQAEQNGKIIPNPQVDSRFLGTIQTSPNGNVPVQDFASDAAAGTLPFYSFLMCWLPLKISNSGNDTSMHPNSDIRPGENYLAAVYAALRGGPAWNDTLLIVTFDENGGVYDHVAPPVTVAPYDGTSTDYDTYLKTDVSFDFTLLGPRIPALLISPWLRAGVATGQYQNTSILRFLEDLAGSPYLTQRDTLAPKLDDIFSQFGLPRPRTDCPAGYVAYPNLPYSNGDLSQVYVAPPGETTPPAYMAKLAKAYGIS